MRSATCYLSADVLRDCRTAADLLGLDCPDAAADYLLRQSLNAIPELQEHGKEIRDALAKIRKGWQEKHAQDAGLAKLTP